MFIDATTDELQAALDSVAEELIELAGISGPPVDMLAVAKAAEVVVAIDERQQCRGRYVRLGSSGRDPFVTHDASPLDAQAAILLRPEPRFERRQWVVAHELGEHVAHRVFDRLDTDARANPVKAREWVANSLANRLLLPTCWFSADAADCGWDLAALKGRYSTASCELIARRMLDFPPDVIISILDHGVLSMRRSNVQGAVPNLAPLERACWQAAHQSACPVERAGNFLKVQCWPVHEPGWKREILRTEVDCMALEPT